MIHVSQPSIGDYEATLVLETLRANQITAGPMVCRFENEFARVHNVKHALACTSGTTALHLALAGHGIRAGHEVIIPDLTYIATANAVLYTGARPVLCDIDRSTWGLDPEHVARLITPRTRAILPVHLYGCAANMRAINDLAAKHGLVVIEDAAEGLGGFYGELSRTRLGACSDAGCFSFYGNKILTTGEGGMVITNDSALYGHMKRLRGMAQDPERRYYHTELAFNYRMTDLQAAVGVAQLQRLSTLVWCRQAAMNFYYERLHRDVNVLNTSAPWMFTCLLPEGADRDAVIRHLFHNHIETRPSFSPLHHMRWLGCSNGNFPVSEDLGQRGLSLPTWPNIPTATLHKICDVLKEALR
jgi:perosamine synthetase